MAESLQGLSIQAALREAQVEFVVALPDIVTCDGLLWPITREKCFRLVNVCKEDEGVSICAGMSYADKRAILLMQHTGFLDSINAILKSMDIRYLILNDDSDSLGISKAIDSAYRAPHPLVFLVPRLGKTG